MVDEVLVPCILMLTIAQPSIHFCSNRLRRRLAMNHSFPQSEMRYQTGYASGT
jgi:hypothetical protein